MRTNVRNILNSIGMGFLGILLAIGVSYSTYATFYSDLSPDFSPFVSVLLFVFFFASFTALSALLVLALMDSFNIDEYNTAFLLPFGFALMCAMITNQLFLKDIYQQREFARFELDIRLNNEGKLPQTELYKEFKKAQAENNYDKLLAYKTDAFRDQFYSLSSDKAVVLKLAAQGIKDHETRAFFDEINKDGFISIAEYNHFKEKVLNQGNKNPELALALSRNN